MKPLNEHAKTFIELQDFIQYLFLEQPKEFENIMKEKFIPLSIAEEREKDAKYIIEDLIKQFADEIERNKQAIKQEQVRILDLFCEYIKAYGKEIDKDAIDIFCTLSNNITGDYTYNKKRFLEVKDDEFRRTRKNNRRKS